MMRKTISVLRFNINKNNGWPLIANDTKDKTWRTMKSNDGALTRIVMHFTYKEEIYSANIIQTLDSEFS